MIPCRFLRFVKLILENDMKEIPKYHKKKKKVLLNSQKRDKIVRKVVKSGREW